MRQGDIGNAGRADYEVPANRLDDSFFDIFLWQKRTPDSPHDGSLGSTSMVFHDDAGPEGADLVVGGYHWPKGVQGMDRETGRLLWNGNPDGGESIGEITPAFSPDGSSIYVINDAAPYAVMAFSSAAGPAVFRHNGGDPDPHQMGSPKVAGDGRIFLHRWYDRAYGLTDSGTALTATWAAATQTHPTQSEPALYQDVGGLQVVIPGQFIAAYDGVTGAERWHVLTPSGTDSSATIDPANGNIYVPLGYDDIYVAGLDKDGHSLWGGSPAVQVYDWIDGSNNRQGAWSAGALSHDGATYYFQTVSEQGDGGLYAIDTADGTVKWTFATGSQGWGSTMSSPIVTRNGVVIVGNNEGDRYYAIQDTGSQGTLLDVLPVDPAGNARASATLAQDGRLYLPLRTVQSAGAAGESPSFRVENLFTAIDVTENATASLYPPGGQLATSLNHAVEVRWTEIPDPAGQFSSYAIYRSTEPFSSIPPGMLPIGTVNQIGTTEYVDVTALNGTSYHYAVTAVSQTGGEVREVASIGPRTPRDETDLQVVSIARSPEFPRYDVLYTYYEVTEPGGFGPYAFSASSGLGGGQTFADPRFPAIGQPVTYTATVRNRGTHDYAGLLPASWSLDGQPVLLASQAVNLEHGDVATFTYVLNWDDQPHELTFTIDLPDARPANNTLTSDPLAVPFLTYVDSSFVEDFREVHTSNPAVQNDDIFDWLNAHMARFNELFALAGTDKRVHYGVLEVLDDSDPDPSMDWSDNPYAIFPFRYRATDGNPRLSGYYHGDDDIDYGLLHEMGHQLGLIDIYQLDVPAGANQVSGLAYNARDGLMRGVSPFVSDFSAYAMTSWLHEAHGYYGQFLYDLPRTMQLRILGRDGNPLAGAEVRVYQYCERPGQGKVITDQVKFQGTTDGAGIYTLPNVDIDESLAPPVATGEELRDNPFGYLAVVGTNGVFLVAVEYDGVTEYTWLDVTEANLAYWEGQTETAVFERSLPLGGPVQTISPEDMAELNAADWAAWAEGSSATVADDTVRKLVGEASIRFVTDGGSDNYARYPETVTARWDLTGEEALNVSVFAENANLGFQSGSPWIRLKDADGDYYQYQNYRDGNPHDKLQEAIGQWQTWQIPLDAPADAVDGWRRTAQGTPDLTTIRSVEIHADTWGAGFTLWIDGVGFGELADTFWVTNTEDSGAGSLRAAIEAANAAAKEATIVFAIPDTDPGFVDADSGLAAGDPAPDVFLIQPLSALPPLANPSHAITIDGSSQPAFGGDTNALGPEIVIDGSLAGDWTHGLQLLTSGHQLSDLNIRNFFAAGVYVPGDASIITGCYIGTDATGTLAMANGWDGIHIQGSIGNWVGGADSGDGNVVSGNRGNGIRVSGDAALANTIWGNRIGTDAEGRSVLPNLQHGVLVDQRARLTFVGSSAPGTGNLISGNGWSGVAVYQGATETLIEGNFIGTDATGTLPLPNGSDGVEIRDSSRNYVGGVDTGAGNLISGNQCGVSIFGREAVDNVVLGNFIGVNAAGTAVLGNAWEGVRIESADRNQVGGLSAGEGNAISFNGGGGVVVVGPETTGNAIRGNAIHTNAELGIDLNQDGVTANDPSDADNGANGLQNYPVQLFAEVGATTVVSGRLESSPAAQYELDFYASPEGDPSGYGEGARYLGTGPVITDALGVASFRFELNAVTALGEAVTATATDRDGNTSEFSQPAVMVTVDPLVTSDRTPELTGRVGHPTAAVKVTVADTQYLAVNHGNGTWTLPDNAISPPLDFGIYDVQVVAVDAQGKTAQDATADELKIVRELFSVESMEVTPSGFVVAFSQPFDPSVLNLYDVEAGSWGPADATLVRDDGLGGSNAVPVAGSLVVEARRAAFIATGGTLLPGRYVIRLRSAANGFVDAETGQTLDGDDDGNPGGDYHQDFVVPAGAAVVVGLPDFTRGPGQPVDVPATSTGLPLSVDNAAGIESIHVTVGYDPLLLAITGAALGPAAPAGSQLIVNPSAPGEIRLSFYSPTPMTAGFAEFVMLAAQVPCSAAYGVSHVLDVRGLRVNEGAIAAVADDAVHAAAYFGDTTGNGDYSGLDAQRVARVVVLLDSGFAAHRLTDPVVIADATGNGSLTGTDAVRIAQEVAGLDPPEIPPIPACPPPGPAPAEPPSVSSFGSLPEGEPFGTWGDRRDVTASSAAPLAGIGLPEPAYPCPRLDARCVDEVLRLHAGEGESAWEPDPPGWFCATSSLESFLWDRQVFASRLWSTTS